MVWLEKWFWVPQAVLAGVLYLLGGWSWVVWGVAVRTVFAYHVTWLVNSASHVWGYCNSETKDDSRNNWWVALISLGTTRDEMVRVRSDVADAEGPGMDTRGARRVHGPGSANLTGATERRYGAPNPWDATCAGAGQFTGISMV